MSKLKLSILFAALVVPWQQRLAAQCPATNPVNVINTANAGNGSLRWAIDCVNAVPALTTVQFAIPGPGLKIIQPGTQLSVVTKTNALIDGTTQDVILDGSSAGSGAHGLVLAGTNITVQGLYIRNFTGSAAGSGIHLAAGNGHTVQNNRLAANQNGVSTGTSVTSFTIANNIIGLDGAGNPSGNSANGIWVQGAPSGAGVFDNTIANIFGNGVNVLGNGTLIISTNSMYCNLGGGIQRTGGPAEPVITQANTQKVSGTAAPGRVIEVFEHSTAGCGSGPPAPCQGRTFLGSVTTPASGTWTLNLAPGSLPSGSQVTATSTQNNNNTSRFAACATVADCSSLFVNTSSTNPSCFGGSNGSATATGGGGSTPFNYSWNTGANTQTINNLTAGTYTVTVTAGNGCTATQTAALSQPQPLSASVSTINVDCFGNASGTASASGNGGTPNYAFQWNTGASTATLTNLTAGSYTVTVSDANNCTATQSATITQPTALSVSASVVNVSCAGGANGSATASGSGGTPTYAYAWSNGNIGPTASNLSAGVYSVTVFDAFNCSASQTVTIGQPPALTLQVNTTDETGPNANDGTATAIPGGGSPTYAFLWSTGATTSSINNLAPGIYTVTVTDAAGCTLQEFGVVNSFDCSNFTLTLSGTDIDCAGNNNGSASATPAGGTPNYSYSWSNGANTSQIISLPPATYTVTVQDAAGCTRTAQTTITEPPALVLSVNATGETGPNTNDGTATAIPGGGTPNYTYLWTNGATMAGIANLAPGVYTVTVTDASGCTARASATVNAFNCAGFSTAASATGVDCNGDNTGTATATPSGGAPTYFYAWSNGANTAQNGNLAAGTYTVTVTDGAGCTTSAQATVTEPPALSLSISSTNATGPGMANGSAAASAGGGTPPLQYFWNTGATGSQIGNLTPGLYSLTITDGNNCTLSGAVTVGAGNSGNPCTTLPAYALYAPAEVCGNEVLTLIVDDLYPDPAVQYRWLLPTGDTLQTTEQSVDVLVNSTAYSGEYFVVRDSAGCLSIPVGGAPVNVVSLPPGALFAGNDTVVCAAGLVVLQANAPAQGSGTWVALGSARIDQASSNLTAARDLSAGANAFVWQISLGNCPKAAADTVVFFQENPPAANDDQYTIQRVQDIAVMEVLLNDALGGLQDTVVTLLDVPASGTLEYLPESYRFRYTAEEGFRGTIQFRYVVCNPSSMCGYGCDTALVTIRVLNLPSVQEGLVVEDPGPNGRLTIRNINGFTRVAIRITDRWGSLVFEEKEYDNSRPWLGDYRRSGRYLPRGAYYFLLEAFDGNTRVGDTQTGIIYLFEHQ